MKEDLRLHGFIHPDIANGIVLGRLLAPTIAVIWLAVLLILGLVFGWPGVFTLIIGTLLAFALLVILAFVILVQWTFRVVRTMIDYISS
jgi:hypothetical protein